MTHNLHSCLTGVQHIFHTPRPASHLISPSRPRLFSQIRLSINTASWWVYIAFKHTRAHTPEQGGMQAARRLQDNLQLPPPPILRPTTIPQICEPALDLSCERDSRIHWSASVWRRVEQPPCTVQTRSPEPRAGSVNHIFTAPPCSLFSPFHFSLHVFFFCPFHCPPTPPTTLH